MKLILLAALATVAVAAPQGYAAPVPSNTYAAPRSADSDESVEHIPILRNDLVQEEDGSYSLDVETGNGIVLEQSGDSDGDKQGVISFTHPDGTPFHLTYVADENGFQPQSDALPVAPAFPHPIPEFVLEQIRFAASQKDSSEEVSAPRNSYSAPRSRRDAPSNTYAAPRSFGSDESVEHIPILRQDLVQEEDGSYSLDVETGNGIVLAQSGDSDGDKQGVISFTHPDGTPFHLTYVADENGFQPQSDALPVAPAFPHPIPEFVLEQIRFAASQKDSSEEGSAPCNSYSAPRSRRDAPSNTYAAPRSFGSDESVEHIPILRQDLVQEEDGSYSLDVETANGIVLAQSGDSDGDKQGVISFTHPDGTPFHLTYVADENGFQPQSDALPVAPAFPHPIPEFVLEQIRFAASQKDSSEEVSAPRNSYSAPRSRRAAQGYSAPAPSNTYAAPRSVDSDESVEHIPILRHDLEQEEDGTYSLDVETANGIVLAQSGDSDGDKQGSITFTLPDGTEFHMTYVADENGFQPQSDFLPVAPAFPHPIPEFVLEQIEFARQQDEAAARNAKSSVHTPSSGYGAPDSSEEN